MSKRTAHRRRGDVPAPRPMPPNEELFMRLSRATLIRIVAAFAGVLALAVPTGVASASGLTLHLTAPSPAIVGKPMVLHATGSIPPPPPGDMAFSYWFSLDAVPTSVTSTCPSDSGEGLQFGASSGSILVLTQRE